MPGRPFSARSRTRRDARTGNWRAAPGPAARSPVRRRHLQLAKHRCARAGNGRDGLFHDIARHEQQRRGLRMRGIVRQPEARMRRPQGMVQRIDEEPAPRDRADMPAAAMQVDLEMTRHLFRRRHARARAAAAPVRHRESIVGVTPAHTITRLPLSRGKARRFRQSRHCHATTLRADSLPGKH